MAAAARACNVARPELGYESMSHFVVDTDDLADVLRNIDFCSGMWNNTNVRRRHCHRKKQVTLPACVILGAGDEEEEPEQLGEESELDSGSRH